MSKSCSRVPNRLCRHPTLIYAQNQRTFHIFMKEIIPKQINKSVKEPKMFSYHSYVPFPTAYAFSF